MGSPVITDHLSEGEGVRTPAGGTETPVVIDVRDVEKTFRVPDQRIDSLKERASHPFTRVRYRELHALRRVSFDVRRGEFFGIVGRNGSGKSTLLKIMASIYGADGGRVRTAGRIAPFIELGVGFDPELSGRENVVLNGVLMGLSRREARGRLDAVLEFAELKAFADLKLKNYSSGMMVRLAFAVMVQADADVMLIDEVLAVGDAAFAQKCMDVFHERRRAGKTVVLVTHDMATVQLLCHRAMLLHDGELRYLGEPEEAALRYYRLNFVEHGRADGAHQGPLSDFNVRAIDASLRDPTGSSVEAVEEGMPIRVDILVEAARDLRRPHFLFHVVRDSGAVVCAFTQDLDEQVTAGQRVRLTGEIENRLVPGRYYIDCWIDEGQQRTATGLQALRIMRFLVFGSTRGHGLVTLKADIEAAVEPPSAP